MAAEMAERDPELRGRLAEVLRRKQALLAARLESLRATDELSKDADPQSLAGFTVTTLQGGLLLASVMKDADVLAQAVSEVWRHLSSFRNRSKTSQGEDPVRE